MQGSVTVTASPFDMENAMFRQKLGMGLSRSVLQGSSSNGYVCGGTPTSRCLFGPPDPKESKDLVRAVGLKNAINFGKTYNFDIINGEPFPAAKKMKMSHDLCEDSDEENVNLNASVMKGEGIASEGYDWSEKFSQDFMAQCNKHAVNSSIVGPSRHGHTSVVALLYAPVVFTNHGSTTATKSLAASQESPKPTKKSESSSPINVIGTSPLPQDVVLSPETNNNDVINNKSHSTTTAEEKKLNRINANNLLSQPSAKNPSICAANHIVLKYTQKVKGRNAVMKKPRKSVITDYMQARRMKASNQQDGKKQ